jgi:N-acetyl-beta-hexosaminidase
MKKRKLILSSALALATVLSSGFMNVSYAVDGPYIANPSFENPLDASENQVYKAERTDEKAFDGKYSMKVGMVKPTDESKVPLWRYTQGKGSVNVIIHNVKPNTKYDVSIHYFNETGVKMSTGVLDIEGKHTTSPWQLASSIKTDQAKSADWKEHTHTLTTGPRTNEIYAFAYTEWTGNETGSGLFYVDGVEIKESDTQTSVDEETSIEYTAADLTDFPATVPAISEFEKGKEEGFYNISTKQQVFSTDEFSQEKTKYLAESMVKKGIIEDYSIRVIEDVKDGKGIVVVKQPIQFKLPENIKESQIDAYQIDITSKKIVIYSDYIEGIQNGTMTLLQAFAQRKALPLGSVHDYTDQVIRGLQVDSGRRYYSIDWLKDQVEQMAYYKQNKLQLRLKDNEGIRYESKVAAAMIDEKGGYWTQEEVDELVNWANQFNIEVIPEIDFPGHAEQDAFFYKDWGLGGSLKALDFSKPEVREYMINVYKEAADFFHAKTIHIGGDEFFQSGYTTDGKKILEEWIRKETGDDSATDKDAIKWFFNEAAEELFKKDLEVVVWNDNIFDLEGVVPLDKRIIIDFWAGTMYGSIGAPDTANAGYQIMSSSSSNYHDLWPQRDKLDRPLPKRTYEEFTRYHYSKASYSYSNDVVLTDNLDKSLGQMFPIWDDAHGYVPEYILTRSLFPRYAGFALKTWGADFETAMSYAEFERLIFALGSPRDDLYTQSKINYNESDLDLVIAELEGVLVTRSADQIVANNVSQLQKKINDVKANKASYQKDGFYTEVIDNLIYDYENIQYTIPSIDKDDLEARVEEALKVTDKELEIVIPIAVTEFKEALKEAQDVLADTAASQDAVDEAYVRLVDAIDMLKKHKGDKTELEKLVKNAEQLSKNQYNDTSWKALATALERAKVVLNDENATAEEVANAQKQLQDALDALIKIDTHSEQETIKTGDSTNLIVIAAVCLVAFGGIILSMKKKKQNM